jgi:hypothetical protein
MSQRRDDFYADLDQFGASDETRPVYERLDADARAWSATVGDETPLIAFARSLPHRSREETMRMPSQPNHPEWEPTQRLPYANPGNQPQQRPSRLRTWVAVVAVTLVVALLGGSFYALRVARNNGTPATPTATTAQATDTPLPTTTATATPLPTATAAQFAAACPNGAPLSGIYPNSIYQIGDLYLAISLDNLSYPSAKVPDGTPLKPFKLPPGDKWHAGLPAMPEVDPGGKSMGIIATACNGSKTLSHHIEGVSVRIENFAPFAGDLNSWQYCDGRYRDGQVVGTGCGGGRAYGEAFSATFATGAGAGAVVSAAYVEGVDGALPLTRQPGQGTDMFVLITPPAASGTYHFSFSVRVDGVDLPFALLTDDLLLAPARKWTGAACATPAMQSQIPAGSTDAYICPES